MSVNVHSHISFVLSCRACKTSTALIEVVWELWKLAKLAREKGQHFFDPWNITMFLVEKKYY